MPCFHIRAVTMGALLGILVSHSAHAEIVTFGSGANQFDMKFVPIGSPDNTADTTGSPNPAGSVAYQYNMGKFEVSEDMINKANNAGSLGITMDTRGIHKPATSVSWYEAARFVNWLNTSQGFQAAYKFDGSGFQLWSSADAWQLGGENLFRHRDAHYWLPSVDEWYKAAYYDPAANVYYDYPTGSDSVPDGIDFAGDTVFDAVFYDGGSNAQPQPNDTTNAGVLSPFGTAGQGGNVYEWQETEFDLINDDGSSDRGIRGGYWGDTSHNLSSSRWGDFNPAGEDYGIGFRVASLSSVPEPSSLALSLTGVLALGWWRWRRSETKG